MPFVEYFGIFDHLNHNTCSVKLHEVRAGSKYRRAANCSDYVQEQSFVECYASDDNYSLIFEQFKSSLKETSPE